MDQNGQYQNSIQAFSVAAVVFGAVSLLMFFTGIIPLFAGGLSLLFVSLSHRKGQPLTVPSRIGLYLAVLGILLGVLLLVYTYFTLILPMMKDPAFFNEMNTYYQNNFGVSLDELLGFGA